MRLILHDVPGMFAKAAQAIAKHRCIMGEVQIVRVDKHYIVRDLTIYAPSGNTADAAVQAVSGIGGVRVARVTNDVLEAHRGGKVSVVCSHPLETTADFRKIAFPGVLEACRAIRDDESLAREYTIAGSSVAVVSNGTEILGLGDIGALAALPYLEGLSALVNRLGCISAFPLPVDNKEAYGFVDVVKRLAPAFAGIIIGGIAEPEVLEIADRLEDALPIPIFLTGRHGTAVSALATVFKGLERANKKVEDAAVLVSGTTEAAYSTIELLKAAGFEKITVADAEGAVYSGRPGEMHPHVRRIAETTNRARLKGTLDKLIKGRDVYVGFDGRTRLTGTHVKSMAADPIVLPLGEPEPEIHYKTAYQAGAILVGTRGVVTISHGLCGIVRGTIEAGASKATTGMCLAAAKKLAALAEGHRDPLPLVLESEMHEAVAEAVAAAK
jgi:malate dehydrogenase (oxaloacetate-decarboxylating)